MGIPGLDSLIKKLFPGIFRDYRLSGTKIIIDGSGLLYVIHSTIQKHVPLSHGGEYELLRHKCELFFQNLLECDCRPYVIFDGCCDLDDKKLNTYHTRFKRRITRARSGFRNMYYRNFMPPLAWHLIKQVMREMEVPFVFSQFESDEVVAALASEWQCPIMTTDCDFYVIDCDEGVIHLDNLKWEKTSETNDGHHFIEGKIYHIDEFCKAFRVRKEFLPLFATLAGNDYVEPPLNDFLNRVDKNGLPSDRHTSLRTLLGWIHRQNTFQDACNNVFKIFPELEQKIRLSLDAYDKLPDIRREKGYFEKKCTQQDSQLCTAIGAPAWVVEAQQTGEMSSPCLDVLSKGRYFSPIDFEDYNKPSSWMPAKFLFSVLCSIIVRAECKVFIRKGTNSGHLLIPSLNNLNGYGTLPSLSTIPSPSDTERLILRVLAPSLPIDAVKDFSSDLQLALLAMRYCIGTKENLMEDIHINALLLRWVRMDTQTQHASEVLLKKEEELREGMPDPKVSHGFAQWQHCFETAMFLNEILKFPLPSCSDISLLFNGLTMHAMCAMLQEEPDVEQFISSQEALRIYRSMRRFVFGNT